jgi:hypothetical protein
MLNKRMESERLIGFDARVLGVADWDAGRRAQYLLRPETPYPMSVDPAVWPSIFDKSLRDRPAWTGPFQSLWEDLSELRQYWTGLAAGIQCDLIAVTVHADGNRLDEFLKAHSGYDPATGRPVALPNMRPDARANDWQLLGYDVADLWGESGLSNCGYDADTVTELKVKWTSRLNGGHLFSTLGDADDFCLVTNARAPEHAPFLAYGLWSIETRR